MAHPRDIEALRKDPDRWRRMMEMFLKHHREALSDEALDFLGRVSPLTWLEEISYRQGEWLFAIKDRVTIVSIYRGFSLRTLIHACYCNRLDLSEDDQEWIEGVYALMRYELPLYLARRVYRLAHQVGEVDHEDAA